MKSFISAMKNYVNFKGTATRSEFWYFILQYMLIEIILSIISGAVRSVILLIIMMLFNVAMVIPCLALTFRRMHDAGFSGWCSFIPFYRIYLFCCPSVEEKYPNNNHNNAKVVGIIFLIMSVIGVPVCAGITATVAAASFSQYQQKSKAISKNSAENMKIVDDYMNQRTIARQKVADSNYSAEASAEYKAEQEKILKALIEEHKDNPDRQIAVKQLTELLNQLQEE